MSFLSLDNLHHVVALLRGFFQERYNYTVPNDVAEPLVSQIMQSVFAEFGKSESLDALNRRTLILTRNSLLSNQEPSEQQAFPDVTPPDRPVSDKRNEEIEEHAFVNRLKQLEESRKLPVPSAPVEPTTQVVATKPIVPSPPVPENVIQTIYVPAPVQVHIPLWIHGKDRDWELYHERCLFVWNGSLPTEANPAGLRVVSAFIKAHTPYVRLCIEGAGHQHAEIILEKDTYWKPCSDTLGRLIALSTPWTITIRDIDGEPLDIGYDGWSITGITPRGGIEVDHTAFPHAAQRLHLHFAAGEWIVIRDKKYQVMAVFDSRIDLYMTATTNMIGQSVLNLSRQPIIMLEASTKK